MKDRGNKAPKPKYNPYMTLYIVLLALQKIPNYEELKKQNARFNCFSMFFNLKWPTLQECERIFNDLDKALRKKQKRIVTKTIVLSSGKEYSHTFEVDTVGQYTYETLREKILSQRYKASYDPLFPYHISLFPILRWNEVEGKFRKMYRELQKAFYRDYPEMRIDRIDKEGKSHPFDAEKLDGLKRDVEIYEMWLKEKSPEKIGNRMAEKNMPAMDDSSIMRSRKKIQKMLKKLSDAVFLPHELPHAPLKLKIKSGNRVSKVEVQEYIYPKQKSITEFLPDRDSYKSQK